MPIELSIDEVAERLGNRDDRAFLGTIASVLYHAQEHGTITSRMVQADDGYIRKFSFALESEVPRMVVRISEDGNVLDEPVIQKL